MAEASPGVPYGVAKAKRDEDDAKVLAAVRAEPKALWNYRAVAAQLPGLTRDRVKGALTRLTMQGKLTQGEQGQANHYYWRLAAREG